MPLPERCVHTGVLVRNYGITNVAPTQKGKPPFAVKFTPFPNTKRVYEQAQITGLKTKNDCDSYAQKQFTGMHWTGLRTKSLL